MVSSIKKDNNILQVIILVHNISEHKESPRRPLVIQSCCAYVHLLINK